MTRVQVKHLIGSRYAWNHDQGFLVSESVLTRIRRNGQVDVDFSGVKAVTLQFLNSAIGNLVREVPCKDLMESISFVNFPLEHARLFEAILIVWMEIEFDPHQVLKRTSLMEKMAFLLTPFEKRGPWSLRFISEESSLSEYKRVCTADFLPPDRFETPRNL